MKRICETAILLIGTIGWWGFVYPELSSVTQSYVEEAKADEAEAGKAKVEEAEAGMPDENRPERSFFEKVEEWLGSTGIPSGDVRIKSRVAEYLYQEKRESEKESDYERQKRARGGV